MKKVQATTYSSVLLGWEETGLNQDDLSDLPWVRAGVATVRSFRLGAEVRIGAYAGRLQIGEQILIEVAELVPGTARACLELSRTGRRQGEQVSPSGLNVSADRALAARFTESCLAVLQGGAPRKFVARDRVTSRPSGKVLAGRTVAGPWARGRAHEVLCRKRLLSDDTPLTRVLLGASMVAERLLDTGPAAAQMDARRCAAILGGATRGDFRADLRGLAHLPPLTAEAVSLAGLLIEGVPSLPRGDDPRAPQSAWLNLDRLFEEAVRAVLTASRPTGTVRTGRSHGVQIFGSLPGEPSPFAKRADPDVVVSDGPNLLVLDAKYRRSGAHPTESELYQLMAHAAAFGATHSALVAPALDGRVGTKRLGRDPRGFPMDVVGVDASDARRMEGTLVGWLRDALAGSG